MALELNVVELKQICDQIFDHILDLDKNFKINVDDYWIVEPDDRYNLNGIPGDLGVGKLSDDWQFLRSIIENRATAVPYMFVHVAPLLEAIAEAFAKKED